MRHPFLVPAAVLTLVVAVFACHSAKRPRGDGLTDVESEAAETPTPPAPEAEETAMGCAEAGVGGESRLVLDSWTRPKYASLTGGRAKKDATIERRFRRYGEYAGLAFWLFLTRDWVED